MASPINNENDNSATNRDGRPKSSKNQTYNFDWIKNTNAKPFIFEEQNVFKRPVTDSGYQKRLSKYNGLVNRMTSEEINNELRKRSISTSGDIDIRRARLKYHHKAQVILGSDDPLKMISQEFEYIAVIDFEATCNGNQQCNYPHEIIEFPIVLIDVQQQAIVDKLQLYCRPRINPVLSDFCKDLTGIQQHQVDNASDFTEVLKRVETWLHERNLLSNDKSRCAFATDGPWDFAKFLRLQCRFNSITYPHWARRWINVRKEFSNFYSVRRCGIEKMLQYLGFKFEGHHHSGLDDSTNIARIAIQLIKDGCILSLNDSVQLTDPQFLDLNRADNNLEDMEQE